jgi:hypothetical protein
MSTPPAVRTLSKQLELGRGPVVLELFVDPLCEFSERAVRKLDALLSANGAAEALTVRLRLFTQPWHLLSPALTRCIVAAGLVGAADERPALSLLTTVYDHRTSFDCDRHCAGPNLALSPADVIARLSALSGLELASPFESDEVTSVLTWYARYGRQNGIHETPTFAVDGLVNPAMSSSQTVPEWLSELGLAD